MMIQSKKKIIAITGGIGTGKSYICHLLGAYNIQVYDCDAAAKRLMRNLPDIQSKLKALVGNNVYKEGELQKAVLAQFILASTQNKQAVNNIVHPAVANDFLASSYQWIESAILFDAHFNQLIQPTYVICVTAPIDIRAKRIMQRDHITKQQALQWINKQMPQQQTVKLSNVEIKNDGITNLTQQIEDIIRHINSL